MQKISSFILTEGEEYLLLLSRWLEASGDTQIVEDLAIRCITEKLSANSDKDFMTPSMIESAADNINSIIYESRPTSDLHHIFGDWWGVIVDNWLQDGLSTLSPLLHTRNTFAENLLEIMDVVKVNEGLLIDINDECLQKMAVEFIMEWRAAAFKNIIKALNA